MMMSAVEITIPRSRKDLVWHGVLISIVVIFGFFAILNLANLVAIVPSVLWLSFVTCIVSTRSPEAGGNIQVCPLAREAEEERMAIIIKDVDTTGL
jgi:hypothetical protein